MSNYNKEILTEYNIKITDQCKTTKKMHFGEDSEGYTLHFNLSGLRNGNTPPRFSKTNPYTFKNIKHYLSILHPSIEMTSTEYENSSTPLFLNCTIHGEIQPISWTRIPHKLHPCSKCKIKKVRSSKKYDYNPEFLNRYGITPVEDCKLLSKTYPGKDSEGYILWTSLASLRVGTKPNRFSNMNPYTLENIKHFLKLKHSTLEITSKEYKSTKQKLDFNCNSHRKTFQMTLDDLRNSSFPCSICREEDRQLSRKGKYNEEVIKNYKLTLIEDCNTTAGTYYGRDSEGYLLAIVLNGLRQGTTPRRFGKSNKYTMDNIKHAISIHLPSKEVLSNSEIESLILSDKYNDEVYTTSWSELSRTLPGVDNRPQVGWTKTQWRESAKKSNHFDSFKVYILECYNEEENFIKVGRTFNTVFRRFQAVIPYQYKILHEISSSDADTIYDLENKIHHQLRRKALSYTPRISFKGEGECFTSSEETLTLLDPYLDIDQEGLINNSKKCILKFYKCKEMNSI